MLNCQDQSEVESPEGVPDSGRSEFANTKQILVVDDEPMIQRLIDRVLSTLGHNVELAGDGETAWLMLQRKNYDCIIMDWKMPGLTGRELYQLIEDQDREMANRCLFISGHAANSEVEEFVSNNGNIILLKPFPIEELKTVVGTLLEITADRS
jgi:two-component system sensor histidine kinase EvgS